ncbi:MAG: hypothetical protein IPJ65_41185 [Archangiaceae bacterium]|nr:hypothetical protein [Archangiaceae bacterium]
MTDGETFQVVVPPELTRRWADLPHREHVLLSGRLERAARRAHTHPTVWPEGPAGAHRGRHRAIVEDLWLLYRLDSEVETLSLLNFGHVVRDDSA